MAIRQVALGREESGRFGRWPRVATVDRWWLGVGLALAGPVTGGAPGKWSAGVGARG